jgi:hypothetical protein
MGAPCSFSTVWEYSKHYREFSLVNNHQSDLDIHDDPYVFTRRTFIVEPQSSMSYSFCFCDTCNIWGLIIGISIPSSISLPTLSFTLSVIFHPLDLVTCCNIGWNLTDWAQSIFSSRGRTNPALHVYASTFSIRNPRDTFLVTLLRCEGWCNQSFLRK